jgi:spermidine synthase
MLLVGAYAIGAQIFFIRELLVLFFGNELCIGIIFGSWFLGITAGAFISGKRAQHVPDIGTIFFIVIIVLTLLPFLLIPVMRLLRGILAVPSGEHFTVLEMLFGTALSVCPFSFIIGYFFPIACKAILYLGMTGSAGIGMVYVWESAGSLVGGCIISLVLIPSYSPLQIFSVGALMLWLIAVCYLIIDMTGVARIRLLAVLLSLLVIGGTLAAGGYISMLDEYLTVLRWKTFNNELSLVVSRDSRYQNIIIARNGGQYNIFTDGQFIGSYPDEYQSAVNAHLFLCQHPSPQHVLVIGGGLTGLIRNILQHKVKTIDYVELDAEMVNLIIPVLAADDREAVRNPRVHISFEDGRKFVKNSLKHYNLILILTPEPSTASLNRFYTIEFLREVKRTLADGGIMVIGLPSSAVYLGEIISPYAGSLYKSLQAVYPYLLIMPQEDRYYFFAASQHNLLTADASILEKRFNERKIQSSPSFSPALFSVLVQTERIEFVNEALNKKTDTQLNTDFRPITYFYNLLLWETIAAGRGAVSIIKQLSRISVLSLVLVIIIFCAARIIWSHKRGTKSPFLFNGLWAIGTTGCAGMALEIVLIFTFQNLYGYIYQMIGLIVGFFMFGLTLGGYWAKRNIEQQNWQDIRPLVIVEIIFVIYSILLPFLIRLLNISGGGFAEKYLALIMPYLYMLLVFGAGFITGLEFPLVSNMLIGKQYGSAAVAGWVDATDHLGACGGSLFTGTLLLPLAGVYQTCFIIGLLKLSSCIFLLFTHIRND